MAVSLAGRSKRAAQLIAKQSERTKLTNITLPSAYRALGRHVHAEGRFRADFADAYGKIDALLADVAKLTAAGPQVEGFKQKAMAAAKSAKDKTHAQALQVKLNHAYTELGGVAFEKHGEKSGAPGVVKPILDCRARLETLAAEMAELSKSEAGTILTSKRIAIAGLAAAALLLILVLKVAFFGGRHDTTQVDDQLSAVESNEKSPSAVKGKTVNKGGHYAAAIADHLERSKKKYAELEKEEGKTWDEIEEAAVSNATRHSNRRSIRSSKNFRRLPYKWVLRPKPMSQTQQSSHLGLGPQAFLGLTSYFQFRLLLRKH